jgi:predicted nucleic acid-binding protein
MRGILDTSVFIAGEDGRRLATELLPDEAAVSVVTLAELELGVHLARGEEERARRLATLMAVHGTYVPLPVDGAVAADFAELVAVVRKAGRRLAVQDVWIAATSRRHATPIYTHDADFEGLPGVDVVRV